MRKGTTPRKTHFLPFFKLSPFQGLKSPRLPTWFIGSLGLLLHRSNVRGYSKPPVPSGEPPNWGIKPRFSNAIDVVARSAYTGCGRGSRFAATVAGWCKNILTRFEVPSCYGSRDISVLKWKFGNCAKWSLFSYPVTYVTEFGKIRHVACRKNAQVAQCALLVPRVENCRSPVFVIFM